MTSSHAGHLHPATKAGRAICRRLTAKGYDSLHQAFDLPKPKRPFLGLPTMPVRLTLTSLMTATKHAFKVNDGPTKYATKVTRDADWFTADLITFASAAA